MITAPESPKSGIERFPDPGGYWFLREHPLAVVSRELIKDESQYPGPHLSISDQTPIVFRYNDALRIISNHIVNPYNDLLGARIELLQALAYYRTVCMNDDEMMFSLEEKMPLTVILDSPGWENVLHDLARELPGSVLWPEDKRP